MPLTASACSEAQLDAVLVTPANESQLDVWISHTNKQIWPRCLHGSLHSQFPQFLLWAAIVASRTQNTSEQSSRMPSRCLPPPGSWTRCASAAPACASSGALQTAAVHACLAPAEWAAGLPQLRPPSSDTLVAQRHPRGCWLHGVHGRRYLPPGVVRWRHRAWPHRTGPVTTWWSRRARNGRVPARAC